MKNRLRDFSTDIVLYGIMTGVSRLTGFILLPIFTRVLSVDEYGLVEILTTLTTLVATFSNLNLSSAVGRYFFDENARVDRTQLVSTLFAFVAFISIILVFFGSLFSYSISSLLLDSSNYGNLIALAVLAGVLSGLTFIPQIVLRLERKIIKSNFLNIAYSVAYAGGSLYLVFKQSQGIQGIIIASALAGMIQLFMAMIWIKQYLKPHFSPQCLKTSMKFSLPMLPAVIVTWVNSQADRLILLAFLGLSSVGLFGAAGRISMIVKLGTSIFQQAWTPYAMSMLTKPETERNPLYRIILNFYTVFFAGLGLTIITISPEILAILLPLDYQDSYIIIPWLIGASILHGSSNLTNIGIIISEKTYINSIAAWSGSFVNIIFSVILVKILGFSGAAIGTFIAELIFTSILLLYTQRYSSVRFDLNLLLVTFLTYVTASVLSLTFTDALTFRLFLLILLISMALLLLKKILKYHSSY